MAINERHSEKFVEQKMGFDLGQNDFGWVFAQGEHANARIDNALNNAGGKPDLCEIDDYTKGGKGKAKPEYVITFKENDNTIIVVECKSDPKRHCSYAYNEPKKYAVDGVLYYAKYLKEYYNVIAVAVSGTKTGLFRSSMFYWPRGHSKYEEYSNAQNVILSVNNYIELVNGKELRSKYKLQDVKETAVMMHEYLRTVKMTEKLKPICIAGILIALQDDGFSRGYKDIKDFDTLLASCKIAIDKVLHDGEIPEKKIDEIKDAFGGIDKVIQLKKRELSRDGSLRHYINILEMNIKPMMSHIGNTIDALGVFYHEFISYSSGDGNSLGIVLTPQHLTEFMAELINVKKDDKVLDICCGSGAFLVTAMGMMFKNATPDEIEYIRKNNLYGIEQDSDIHTLALANMIVRQDGKSNIIHGDCFDKEAYSKLQDLTDTNGKRISINKGLLNPPYSQKDHTELEFVEQELMLLERGGELAVVCPMSCAIGTKFKEERRRLMEKHTLKAVFSMPDDIFYGNNASSNVCVMVRRAHEPHDSEVPTFFGYYKDDGFVKKKKLGRVDYYNKWEGIKKEWISLYKKGDVRDGLTAKACVTCNDERLCEAYMKTDYSKLQTGNFLTTRNNYLSYLVSSGKWKDFDNFLLECKNISGKYELNTNNWKEFKLGDLFIVSGSKTTPKETLEEIGEGLYPYVTTSATNNGIEGFYNKYTESGNVIVVESACMGYSTYQSEKFSASDHVEILKPKHILNQYIGLFIVTLINNENYRYSYGRKCNHTKINNMIIRLPVDNSGNPDREFMENYIKNLPYGDRI